MSDSAPIAEPVAEPAAEPAAPEPEPVAAVPADDEPATDDPALNAQIAAQAIHVPDGEKLIPESLLRNVAISYRNKLRDAKQGSPEAIALREQLDNANRQLQAVTPLAEAFRAIQSAQPQPTQPQPQQADTGELEEIARDFDFYKSDGTPDLARAQKHQVRENRRAEAIAQQAVAPLIRHTLTGQASANLQRAKATVHPITNQKADPAILDQVVARIAAQGPEGIKTLADPESMKQIWLNAYSLSTFKPGHGQAPAAAAPAAVTPPLVVERSGGAVSSRQPALSASEKKAAKDAGISEKDYLDMAKGMKW